MGTWAGAIAGFTKGFAPTYNSVTYENQYQNIAGGGANPVLGMPARMGQLVWGADSLLKVAQVVPGPVGAIAQLFRIAFHPLISVPTTVVAVFEDLGLYQSSITATLQAQEKYYERGTPVAERKPTTVSLLVDERIRHFALKHDVTHTIENSIVIEKKGEKKRVWFNRLREGEVFDSKCQEITDINGKKAVVRLEYDWEVDEGVQNCVAITVGGKRRFYQLGIEVAKPVQGSIDIEGEECLIGKPLKKKTPDCIVIKAEERKLHYVTGKELSAPTPTCRAFTIDGKKKYFASAKYVSNPRPGLSGIINKIPKNPLKVPTRLSRFTVQVLTWVNQHMTAVVRVSLVAATIALAIFGHYFMALGAFSALFYQYLNQDLGVVPLKVSLFMERWMPMVATTGLLIVGSLSTQILAGATLLMMIPSVNLWAHHQIGKVFRKIMFGIHSLGIKWAAHRKRMTPLEQFKAEQDLKKLGTFPSLQECDAPWDQTPLTLTRKEIGDILNAKDTAYEINPRPLTKDVGPVLNLPEDQDFDKLLKYWDQLPWTEPKQYQLLMRTLIDDQRFIEFLQKQNFPATLFHFKPAWDLDRSKFSEEYAKCYKNHKDQIEEWIGTLATSKGKTQQKFVADWARKQLTLYVRALQGKIPSKGQPQYLKEAIQITAQLLPFFPKMTPNELVETLAILAVQGGGYCCMGKRDAGNDALEPHKVAAIVKALKKGGNQQELFEREVRYKLQKVRSHLLDSGYAGMLQELRDQEFLKNTAQDRHLHSFIWNIIGRGVIPFTQQALADFTLLELIFKESVGFYAQMGLINEYQKILNPVMDALGIEKGEGRYKSRVLNYLRTWVRQNKSLSTAEQHELLNGPLSEAHVQAKDSDEYYPKWNRLILVILGILRPRKTPLEEEPISAFVSESSSVRRRPVAVRV